MTLEDVGTIEAFLEGRAGAWAETTHHISFVVSQSMSILIVLSSKAFVVVGAVDDWALLRSLRLMGKHMCLEILERPATVWVGAAASLSSFVI